MAERFLQSMGIEAAIVPVDLQTADNTGDWVNLALFQSVIILFIKGAGTAGQDPVFTLNQAQDVSGTGAKALPFTTIYSKVGTLDSVAQFTRVTQAAAGTYTDAVSAEAQAIMAVEVAAEDLDINNGFTCVQLVIPDVGGNAQIGTAVYLMMGPRYIAGVALDAKV
jgi:hypothetical protein